MTDKQFLLFSHLTDDGFQIKEAPREGQGNVAISGQVCWFVVVVIKSCQHIEINEDSLLCHPHASPALDCGSCSPSSSTPQHLGARSIGSAGFVLCLSWLWHGVRKTVAGFLWPLPINSDHF